MGMAEECFLADAAAVARAAPGEAAKPQLCPQPRGDTAVPSALRPALTAAGFTKGFSHFQVLQGQGRAGLVQTKAWPGAAGRVPAPGPSPPQACGAAGQGLSGPRGLRAAPGGSLSAQRPQEILGAAFPCPAHWKHLVLGSQAEQGSRPALGCPHGPGWGVWSAQVPARFEAF